jgi:hypothetical protein
LCALILPRCVRMPASQRVWRVCVMDRRVSRWMSTSVESAEPFMHLNGINEELIVAPAGGAAAAAPEGGLLGCPSAPTSTSTRWALIIM